MGYTLYMPSSWIRSRIPLATLCEPPDAELDIIAVQFVHLVQDQIEAVLYTYGPLVSSRTATSVYYIENVFLSLFPLFGHVNSRVGFNEHEAKSIP